jgi:chromosome segregation ATPase
VDAALDNVNVQKVAAYISRRAAALSAGGSKRKDMPALQFLVISLKDSFYSHAQSLIGICRDNERDSSRAMTLDLVAAASMAGKGGGGGGGGGGAAAWRATARQPGGDDEDVDDEE